jgi:hypothetical protein
MRRQGEQGTVFDANRAIPPCEHRLWYLTTTRKPRLRSHEATEYTLWIVYRRLTAYPNKPAAR